MEKQQTKYSFDEVLAAAKEARTKQATARALNVDYTTIRRYCRRWPSLENFFREAREELVSLAESRLWEHVDAGAPWAVTFALKTLGKDQGYTERKEIVEVAEPLVVVTKVVRRAEN